MRPDSSLASSVDEGSTDEPTSTVPAWRATTTPPSPPGRWATVRASPPAAGRSHSAAGASSSLSSPGRTEENRRSPDGVNAAPDSPFAPRVRRRAGRRPVGSTSHNAVT